MLEKNLPISISNISFVVLSLIVIFVGKIAHLPALVAAIIKFNDAWSQPPPNIWSIVSNPLFTFNADVF